MVFVYLQLNSTLILIGVASSTSEIFTPTRSKKGPVSMFIPPAPLCFYSQTYFPVSETCRFLNGFALYRHLFPFYLPLGLNHWSLGCLISAPHTHHFISLGVTIVCTTTHSPKIMPFKTCIFTACISEACLEWHHVEFQVNIIHWR